VSGPRVQAVLYREGQLRAPWRIIVFCLVFALLSLAGQYAVSVLPRQPLEAGSVVVTTLAALLAGWIALTHLDKRPAAALGFPLRRTSIRESVLGLAVGGGLNLAAVLILLITGSAHFSEDSGTFSGYLYFLGWSFAFFAIAAALEEAVFRGYPFQVLVEWIGIWPAALLASVLFSYLHANNPNVTPLALANIFLAGVLLSFAYLRTLSLWFATGLHLGWNWMMSGLLDFPVSGLTFDTPLYSAVPDGMEWWTGGAFGPEAGLAGTLVLLLGTVWMVRTRRFAPVGETVASRPLPLERLEKEGLV
jgi:uncharacterized protein